MADESIDRKIDRAADTTEEKAEEITDQSKGMLNRAGDAAESVKRGVKETLQQQVQRFHGFLDTARESKDSMQAGGNDRLRQGLDNLDYYKNQVIEFEQRMQSNVEGKTSEMMESEWAQKMKSMYESGLDSVVSTWHRITGTAEEAYEKVEERGKEGICQTKEAIDRECQRERD